MNKGFSLVELSIVLVKRIMSFPRRRESLSPLVQTSKEIPAFAGMTSGFSLVELSIVLVILGLLTGGILTGQNLIRAAELRSVTTEYANHKTAINTFRDKYFSLPGDMTNATAFWGAAHTTPATCPGTAGTGTETCDGDGDGDIEFPAGASEFGESFTFWQHMANAGLVEGNYTGVAAAGGVDDSIIGTNVPSSKLSSAGWSIEGIGSFDITDTDFYEGSYGNIFYFGAKIPDEVTGAPILSPEEAWNIDTKLDDSKPGTGVLRIMENQGDATAGQGCTNADPSNAAALASTVDYDLLSTGTECTLIFNAN